MGTKPSNSGSKAASEGRLPTKLPAGVVLPVYSSIHFRPVNHKNFRISDWTKASSGRYNDVGGHFPHFRELS